MLKHDREVLWAVEKPNRKNAPCMEHFFCSAGGGTCQWSWGHVSGGWGCVGERGEVLVGEGTCWEGNTSQLNI